MPFSLLTHTSASGTNLTATTPAIDTSGATLIVVHCGSYQQNPGTLSDSKNNSWTGLTAQDAGSTGGGNQGPRGRLFYCLNPTVGSGHTFTLSSGSACYPALSVASFSGANRIAVFDKQNGAIGANLAMPGSFGPGSITPSENNELIIAGVGVYWGSSPGQTIDSGMTQINSISFNIGNNFGSWFAYKIQTAAAAISPLWSYTFVAGQGFGGFTIASFKSDLSVRPVVYTAL